MALQNSIRITPMEPAGQAVERIEAISNTASEDLAQLSQPSFSSEESYDPDVEFLPPPTFRARNQTSWTENYIKEREKYQIWSLRHRKTALQLQQIEASILFVVVLLIVGYGLRLSYIQFCKGGETESSVKLGPAGFEITSSILGVIILALSFGFLYLYLEHSFSIEEIGDAPFRYNSLLAQKSSLENIDFRKDVLKT